MIRSQNRIPDFENLRRVLAKKPAPRQVLFDFIIGEEMMKFLAGEDAHPQTEEERILFRIKAFDSAGYDFTPILLTGMIFPRKEHETKQSKSLNAEALITDRKSYDDYQWPDPNRNDYGLLERAGKAFPGNMKFIPYSYDGILENVIGIIGYENLCYLLYDDADLVRDVFFQVGSRIEQYFFRCLESDRVGAILCNDDWGFNSSTMVSPAVLREHVFPWYKRIIIRAHELNKPAILHSCGYYQDIIEDIIEEMQFDGRQSYEDKIVPVETAYDNLYPRLAVLGGIDMSFLVRKSPEEVYERTKAMIAKTKNKGGYAVGSGNSIPDFVPKENYLAMLKAAFEEEEGVL